VTADVDPVLHEARVEAAARRHASGVGRLIGIDESGGEARVYFLEGDVVLKTQRPQRRRAKTSLEKEALFLRELERQGDFPVPRVLGHGHLDGLEYLCLTRLAGLAVANVVNMDPLQRAAVLEAVGQTLRRIHGIDQSVLEASGLFPVEEQFASTRGGARRDVVLHANPGPTHAFVDPSRGWFVGLIDFADACRGHPALDLCRWSDDGDTASLLTGYRSLGPLPETFDEIWRLAYERAAGRRSSASSSRRV
jgi:hygromycin-B 7''-O-kinase